MSFDTPVSAANALSRLIAVSRPLLSMGRPLPRVAQYAPDHATLAARAAAKGEGVTRISVPADDGDRARYVKDWIARNRKIVGAGLGGSVLLVPMMAQAQAKPVDVSTLEAVAKAAVNADGSASLTLTNGQIVTIAADAVTFAADGTITIAAEALAAQGLVVAGAVGAGAAVGVAAAIGGVAVLAGSGSSATGLADSGSETGSDAGGDSGGDTGGNPPQPQMIPVVDGYLVDAFVYRDLNGDRAWNAGEPYQVTNEVGEFDVAKLTGSGALIAGAAPQAAIDADETLVGKTVTDLSTGEVFTGRLTAPDGSDVVTPLTTLVQSLVEAEEASAAAPLTAEQKAALVATSQAKIKTALGLDANANLLAEDPVKKAEDGDASQLKAAAKVAAVINLVAAEAEAAANEAAGDGGPDAAGVLAAKESAAQNAMSSLAQKLGEAADTVGEGEPPASVLTDTAALTEVITAAGVRADKVAAVTNVAKQVNEALVNSDGADAAETLSTIESIQAAVQGELVEKVAKGEVSETTNAAEVVTQAVEAVVPLRPVIDPDLDLPEVINAAFSADLTITGTGRPGSEVRLSYGDKVGDKAPTTTVSEDGTWSVTITKDGYPADGTISFVAQARPTPGSGNFGGSSLQSVSLDVDTTAPAKPTVSLTNDSGAADGVTNAAGLKISDLEAGATREIKLGDQVIDLSALPTADGTYTVSVTDTDAAGNASETASLTFTIDKTPPATPTVSLTTDSGSADGVTNTAGLTFSGLETGATREIKLGDQVIDPSALPTADGTYTVSVRDTDAAGNVSEAASITFTLDTLAPVLDVDAPVSGVLGTGFFTDQPADSTVTLEGTLSGAPSGTTVTLNVNEKDYTGTVAESGAFTINVPANDLRALDGTSGTPVPFTFTAKDPAGNIAELVVDLIIDSTRFDDMTLCSIDPATSYADFVEDDLTTTQPTDLDSNISDPVERDGFVGSVTYDPAYATTITDFATAVSNLGGSGFGIVLETFESLTAGNFAGTDAATTYSAATGSSLGDTSGAMSDGTASGTLAVSYSGANALLGEVSYTLFNTGNSAGTPTAGDDPGIATNTGNDADRGFNVTRAGSQYLEVLPGEDDNGGLLVCFDDLNTPVYGFGFHLMGREETKRDVYLDVHLSDGTVYRTTTDTNALNSGGEQFHAFTIDPAQGSITGFVLYEPAPEGVEASLRDIFAIDDLALVVSEKYQQMTPEAYIETVLPEGSVAQTELAIGVLGNPDSDVFKAYQALADALEDLQGYNFSVQSYVSYEALGAAIASGEADIAELGAAAFAAIVAEDPDAATPLLTPLSPDGTTGYFSLGITQAGSDITIEGLTSASAPITIGVVSALSTSGFLAPLVELRDLEIDLLDPPENVTVRYLGSHEAVIAAVAEGEIDLGFTWARGDAETGWLAGALPHAVDNGVIDLDDIDIVWQSTQLPNGPIVVSADVPDDAHDALAKAIKDFADGNTETAANMFGGTYKGFTEVSVEDYQIYIDLNGVTITSDEALPLEAIIAESSLASLVINLDEGLIDSISETIEGAEQTVATAFEAFYRGENGAATILDAIANLPGIPNIEELEVDGEVTGFTLLLNHTDADPTYTAEFLFSNYSAGSILDAARVVLGIADSIEMPNPIGIAGQFESLTLKAINGDVLLSLSHSDAGIAWTNHQVTGGGAATILIEGAFDNEVANFVQAAEKIAELGSGGENYLNDVLDALSGIGPFAPEGVSVLAADNTVIARFGATEDGNGLAFSVGDAEATISFDVPGVGNIGKTYLDAAVEAVGGPWDLLNVFLAEGYVEKARSAYMEREYSYEYGGVTNTTTYWSNVYQVAGIDVVEGEYSWGNGDLPDGTEYQYSSGQGEISQADYEELYGDIAALRSLDFSDQVTGPISVRFVLSQGDTEAVNLQIKDLVELIDAGTMLGAIAPVAADGGLAFTDAGGKIAVGIRNAPDDFDPVSVIEEALDLEFSRIPLAVQVTDAEGTVISINGKAYRFDDINAADSLDAILSGEGNTWPEGVTATRYTLDISDGAEPDVVAAIGLSLAGDPDTYLLVEDDGPVVIKLQGKISDSASITYTKASGEDPGYVKIVTDDGGVSTTWRTYPNADYEDEFDVIGTDGNDVLFGASYGFGYYQPGAGNDRIIGQHDAFDQIDYSDISGGIEVDLGKGTAIANGKADTFSDIDRVSGTLQADLLIAGTGASEFRPLGGNDIVIGHALVGPDEGYTRVRYDRDARYTESDVGVRVDLANPLFIDDLDDDTAAVLNGLLDDGVISEIDGIRAATDGFGDTDLLLGVTHVAGTNLDDLLIAGAETEWFRGNKGTDEFVLAHGGDLHIYDFNAAAGDILNLRAVMEDAGLELTQESLTAVFNDVFASDQPATSGYQEFDLGDAGRLTLTLEGGEPITINNLSIEDVYATMGS